MNLYDNKEDFKTIIINTSENLGLMEISRINAFCG